INPHQIWFRRVIDISDRFLRNIEIGLGIAGKKFVRNSGFDITASSEIMAILALTKDLKDLRQRLGRIVLGLSFENKPVTTEDLKVAGLMSAILKNAVKPNLVQTIENTPCFIHTSPFANVAHGNSSILADKIALNFSEFVITEAGFGADCGAEKFFNIKCRLSGFKPDVAVLVCSIRALKVHSGKFKVTAGRTLDKNLFKENISAIEEGLGNLEKQIENVRLFGIPVVVAINRFATDTEKEIKFVKRKALDLGAYDCCVSDIFKKGSKGGLDLAKAVINASEQKKNFKFLYSLNIPIKEKIKIIAKKIYGAKDVVFSPESDDKIDLFTKQGWDVLPICMAKTQFSLSHDPNLKGRPKGFILPIRDIRAFVGAGFLSPLCGEIQTMPGLPQEPLGEKIDIDSTGKIIGIS
ncbi:MAG: formate--tetrahydrofolate ligase, partial [Candidatus Omnitrophica bacterium]|nr:formate--tetrahydrofolate ligase [Candidatus Omnitrophota bacterium]